MTPQRKTWDTESGRYIDLHLAMTTFGPLGDYGESVVANDNKTTWPDGGYNAPERPWSRDPVSGDLHPVRIGDFMQTASGRKFWPLDPRADEVHIEDIAHALSMQCRYGGHCVRFYSVAEHCVLMARAVAPEHALWALMHDAAEAYVADVPRPLKRHLVGYKDAEAKVMAAICERFGLPPEMPAEVKDADERILADEVCQNMRPMDWHWEHDNPLGVTLRFWRPKAARDAFMAEFWHLVRRRV
jgi:uncharacterized protein